MEKWVKFDKGVIFEKHKQEFLKDYALFFKNNDLCASCPSKLDSYYEDFKRIFIMKIEASDKRFIATARFNGLPLEFGSNIILSNARMTEELALTFLTQHSKGKELFKTLPDNVDDLIEDFNNEDEDSDLVAIKLEYKGVKLQELREQFPNLKATSIDGMLAKILESRNSENE